ncbi:hypothetical protein CFR75_11190 [Komagataeibacter xylinus]|uniref:Uncharacterized protein n=2 Tax=Acetobacterales TaxID=3120395 RepID=A0A318PJZ9_KOMXY|nr:hypothetical protein CFR75_11190 [Komagataeibacter xylinus]GBQ70398.1 hypothetical protein AA15237_0861 [Komagataeibacter xylinus NBRC 15237]
MPSGLAMGWERVAVGDGPTGKLHMAQRIGKERLKALRGEAECKATAGPLYRWLVANADDIEEIRVPGEPWGPYLQAAIECGVLIEDRRLGLQKIGKLWRRLQKIRQVRTTESRAVPFNVSQSAHPSRLPKGWKPDFIDRDLGNLSPDGSGLPAKIDHAEKSASQVASLPATISGCSGGNTTEEEEFPVGRARAEAIKRDLLARLRKKEPGFHRE